MKKILVSLLMTFLLVPCINAEEVSIPSETGTITETTEVNQTEEVPQVGETTVGMTGSNEEVTQQESQVEEKTEAEIELENIINKIAPNNVITMNAPKSLTKDYKYVNYDINAQDMKWNEAVLSFDFSASNYIDMKGITDEDISMRLYNFNEDLSAAKLRIIVGSADKTIDVSLEWKEENKDALLALENYISKLQDNGSEFILEDLSLIKYLVTNKKNEDAIQYIDPSLIASDGIKELLGNNDKIGYNLGQRMFKSLGFMGEMCTAFDIALSYNNVYYKSVPNKITAGFNYIFYVPDETEKTPEAYIKAAQNRINSYIGQNDIKIEKNMTISKFFEQLDEEYLDEFLKEEFGYNYEQTGEYVYTITINGNSYDLMIVRDSSKIRPMIKETINEETGITIKTTSSEVPSDIKLVVKKIEKDSELYKKSINKLSIENALIYDISLYSNSSDTYISKISDGQFEVSVPISEELKGKELIVYHIPEDENSKIEEYPVTIKDNMATFTTTHFTPYILTEKGVAKVPNTYDGIMNFVIMGIIGIVGIGVFFTLKTRKN